MIADMDKSYEENKSRVRQSSACERVCVCVRFSPLQCSPWMGSVHLTGPGNLPQLSPFEWAVAPSARDFRSHLSLWKGFVMPEWPHGHKHKEEKAISLNHRLLNNSAEFLENVELGRRY